MSPYKGPRGNEVLKLRNEWKKRINDGDMESALSLVDHEISMAQRNLFFIDSLPYLLNMKGSTYAKFGQWHEATRYYIKSLRVDLYKSTTWNFLATALREQGKHKWSRECYSKINDEYLISLINLVKK